MATFRLTAQGPFSLAASTRFLEGFTPAGYTGSADQALEMAFPVEGSWVTVGVRVSPATHGATGVLISPADPSQSLTRAVQAQVTRILSLDVDGSGFPAVGERDPVVGELQRRYPGLRPICFWSPYEAAAWAIIGQRIPIRQAARVKARMAEGLGEPVPFGDHTVHAFPAPDRLAGLDRFPGLYGRKPEWLRSLAHAALDGQLDSAHLRSQPYDQAVAGLTRLPGIGPFAAELTLLRGAGVPDRIPANETRLARAVALAYHLPAPPSAADLEKLSQNWAPYRTWVTLLLRAQLEDETGEISGAGPRNT